VIARRCLIAVSIAAETEVSRTLLSLELSVDGKVRIDYKCMAAIGQLRT